MPAKKKTAKKEKCESMCNTSKCGSGACAYFLGFLGAAVFYIQAATGFWMGVWGVVKALFWPAFLVYHAFRFFIGF